MWLLNFNYSFHGQLTVHSCKCIICSNGYYDTTCSISEESSFQWQGISIIFENFPHPSQSFSYSILCCRIADRLLYSTESLFLRGFYTAQEITHILYGLFTALLRGHFDFFNGNANWENNFLWEAVAIWIERIYLTNWITLALTYFDSFILKQ